MPTSKGFSALVSIANRFHTVSDTSLDDAIFILNQRPAFHIMKHLPIETRHCYDCGKRVFEDVHICEECSVDDIPF